MFVFKYQYSTPIYPCYILTKHKKFAILIFVNSKIKMSEIEKNYNGDEFPRIEEIESALGQLDEYNSRHTGIGGALKRVLGSVFDRDQEDSGAGSNTDEPIDYDIDLDSLKDDGEAKLSEEITRYNISPVLKMIGLDLYDQEKPSTNSTSDRVGLPSKQGLYVSDIEPFVTFISSNNESISSSESISKMIKNIYQSMLKDIESTTGDYRDALIKDLADIQQAVANIKYKNDGPNIELGEAFINWGMKPEFEDYLKSRRLGLSGGYGFGAHNWHADIPRGKLEEKWGSLLDHYRKVSRTYGDNNELTLLMKMEIKEELENLNSWVENPPENYKNNEDYMEGVRQSLKIINANAKKLHL